MTGPVSGFAVGEIDRAGAVPGGCGSAGASGLFASARRLPAAAVEQLVDELERILWPLAALDVSPGALVAEQRDTERVARRLVAQLAQTDDDRLAAQTVIDLMVVLWPHAAPEDCGQAGWWRTPLGRLCARSLGREDAEEVSHAVAAAMLGVSRGTVAQLVHRGTLDRHHDGGVLRSSVLDRIARAST